MHCKNCNYALWELAVRQCPECGTPFKPSDFEFTLNAVRYCCPHCEQAYYGTGERGHLVPRAFNCVKCGNAVDMDQMILRPTEGVAEHQTAATAISWANKREKGWFKAFFTTMGNAMGNPNRCIDSIPETSSVWLAIVYMAIHVTLQMVLSLSVVVVFGLGMAVTAGGGGPSIGMLFAAAATLVVTPLLVLAWACGIHVLLAMTGPTKGLQRTIHAVCYSSGNNFIMMVPCLGAYFLWIPGGLWWSISAAFMLARGHGVKAWRAAVASVVPVVLIVALVVGGFIAMVYGVQRGVGRMAATMPGMSTTHQTATQAGQRVALALASLPPASQHPAELLLNGRISPGELLLPGSVSDTVSCSVQNLTLNELVFDFSKHVDHRKALAADANLGGPACRVGDFVFTYQGMPNPPPDGDLWLAIGWPDPTLNKRDPAEVVIAMPNTLSMVMPVAQFTADLDEQNELRKKHGLAPIPHPRTVLATSKKVASPFVTPSQNPRNRLGGEQFGGAGDLERATSLAGALRGINKPVTHIAEVMSAESFTAFDLMDGSEFSQGGHIARMKQQPFGETDLYTYGKMDSASKRREEAAAAAKLDPKTIAYRVGDVIFTHRGIDPALVPFGSKQRGLWTVVAWPEAMVFDKADPDRRVYVGLADASSRSFRIEQLEQELAEQNALREEFGLEPLPDFESITPKSPALGTKPPKMTDKP